MLRNRKKRIKETYSYLHFLNQYEESVEMSEADPRSQ